MVGMRFAVAAAAVVAGVGVSERKYQVLKNSSLKESRGHLL